MGMVSNKMVSWGRRYAPQVFSECFLSAFQVLFCDGDDDQWSCSCDLERLLCYGYGVGWVKICKKNCTLAHHHIRAPCGAKKDERLNEWELKRMRDKKNERLKEWEVKRMRTRLKEWEVKKMRGRGLTHSAAKVNPSWHQPGSQTPASEFWFFL